MFQVLYEQMPVIYIYAINTTAGNYVPYFTGFSVKASLALFHYASVMCSRQNPNRANFTVCGRIRYS